MAIQSSVIIVGGGLAGLSAATYLARAGHAVMLFEKASTPGGRARTHEQNGFFFNQGAHALRLHGAGERILSELDVSYSGSRPSGPGFFGLIDGKIYPFPIGAASLSEISFLTPDARKELIRVFSRVNSLDAEELRVKSLQEWLEEQIQHAQVRQFLMAVARITTFTHAPDLLSAGLALSLLVSQGVLYLDGGWQTLVDGLQQKAQEAGAHLITRTRIKAIEKTNGGYRVHLANGSYEDASAVLLATDPGTASALVADDTNETFRRWAEEAVPVYVACLDIAVRRLPRPDVLVTYAIDRPLYYSVHSAAAHLAPDEGALVHLMKYLRPGKAAEPEESRQELEGLMDLLQPGWRAEVVGQSFLPHMIVSNAIVQARLGGLSGRPGPAVPGFPGLYVAGDWVGSEGEKVDACFASARSAARLIMAQLGDGQHISQGVIS